MNKEWIEKWKEIVGYEKIKEKCKKINFDRQNENLKNELYDFFITNNTRKKFEELGKMNFPNIKKGSSIENANNILFNEKINFIPINSLYCSYLKKYIEDIRVIGSFNKGKCFLYNNINNYKKDKIKEKKVLILKKKIMNNNDEFKALMITLGEKEEIKQFINSVKNKAFEDLMNDKNLKVIKREISQNQVNEIIKNNEEEDKKKKELEEKKKKEEEKKKKEEEKRRKKKEEEDKKNIEIEDKKKKEEEDKKKKEEEDKKKKEEEKKRRKN